MSLGVFQCNATGRYKEAEIQWDLDGRLLTDSPSINLNSKKTLDASTGTYHFTSTLNIKTNESLTPTCNIKAKRISVTQTRVCKPSPSGNCSLFFSLIFHNKIVILVPINTCKIQDWGNYFVIHSIKFLQSLHFLQNAWWKNPRGTTIFY